MRDLDDAPETLDVAARKRPKLRRIKERRVARADGEMLKLSFPIGPEILSRRLDGAPQIYELRLSFHAQSLAVSLCDRAASEDRST